MRRRLTRIGIVSTIVVMSLAPRYLYAEEQPHMQAALQHLREAAEQLQKADHDKGGHRAKALNLTRQAITQVEAGIQYDNAHTTKGEKKEKK